MLDNNGANNCNRTAEAKEKSHRAPSRRAAKPDQGLQSLNPFNTSREKKKEKCGGRAMLKDGTGTAFIIGGKS